MIGFAALTAGISFLPFVLIFGKIATGYTWKRKRKTVYDFGLCLWRAVAAGYPFTVVFDYALDFHLLGKAAGV